MATPNYLQALNEPQRMAVEAVDGPVLVLAGAGTGKTRVLTTRIAHILMQKKAFAGQILAVTFTNKAAAEMRERVDRLLGHSPDETVQSSGVWLGTFHSIGAKILRRHAEALGFTPQFTILDADDQHRLIKQIMAEQNIDNSKCPGKVALSIIQGWKDKALTPEKLADSHQGEDGVGAVAAALYPLYQARLKTLNAMDFGDLLLHCITLFTEHQHILNEYAHRFHYILVDEYQDTNIAQYLWLRLLAMGHQNICCVGDDDQSIYGWRGAEVGNILKFEKDFPDAQVIRLEQNYRSTSPILAAASHLIDFNEGRLGKTLWTDADGGHPVRIKSVWDDSEEGRFVGEEVEAFQRDGIKLDEMAVLVRAGFQTRSFEERFMTLGVPYRVVGGLRFYERMEIRDAVAYLRVVSQPHDDLALERIVNTPKRGLGKATIENLHSRARQDNASLYSSIQAMLEDGSLRGKQATTLRGLIDQFEAWRTKLNDLPLSELTELILDESGYKEMWQKDKTPEAPGRIENLRELVFALSEYESLTQFLEHVGLVTDGGNNNTPDDEMVSIMTLHAAKGLEFDVVFLTGWEEGLFPSQRSMDEKGSSGLEEERRLAYVGITRAKLHCIISHAANRRIYNQWQSSIPSRFLEELPEEHIEVMEGGVHRQRASGPAMFQKEIDGLMKAAMSPSPSSTPKPNGFNKGQPVFHQKFGNGVVLKVEGDHLTIAFKHAGTKKLMADYVKKA
ncbi:MAG: UvrD-helicase domain-containing protein [Rickettsiales bacterium]|nr:UvrD-helicase domain-containing protein [Rickettsiales bacterium]